MYVHGKGMPLYMPHMKLLQLIMKQELLYIDNEDDTGWWYDDNAKGQVHILSQPLSQSVKNLETLF